MLEVDLDSQCFSQRSTTDAAPSFELQIGRRHATRGAVRMATSTGRLDIIAEFSAILFMQISYDPLMDFVFPCIPMQHPFRGPYLIGKTCPISHLRTGRKAAANCSWASETERVDSSDSTTVPGSLP